MRNVHNEICFDEEGIPGQVVGRKAVDGNQNQSPQVIIKLSSKQQRHDKQAKCLEKGRILKIVHHGVNTVASLAVPCTAAVVGVVFRSLKVSKPAGLSCCQ